MGEDRSTHESRTRLTYCTHSISTDNERGIATGWLPGALSERGRVLAAELGSAYAATSLDAVYCSDLARAVETAEIAFGSRYRPVTDPRLRECDYGDLNGAPAPKVHAAQRRHVDTPFPGGESYRDVEQRVASLVADLVVRHPAGHVLVVSHHAPQLALDVVVHGRTWQQAFDDDWRPRGQWRLGWEYVLA